MSKVFDSDIERTRKSLITGIEQSLNSISAFVEKLEDDEIIELYDYIYSLIKKSSQRKSGGYG